MDVLKWLFGGKNDGRQSPTDLAEVLTDPDAAAAVPGFPVALLPYHRAIEATRRPILAAEPLEGLSDNPATSQLGGRPWWPAGRAYPADTNGNPLALLVQVNFDDTPVLEGFPDRGLLQIFIGTDDTYGANFDMPKPGQVPTPHGFASIYHDDTSGPVEKRIPTIDFDATRMSPLFNPGDAVPLALSRATMVMDPSDYRFERMFPEIASDLDLLDAYDQLTSGISAIRLGGYPTFTQTDPRTHNPEIGDVALLTVDSMDALMWGDAGAGQFLIPEPALASRDFSRTTYNWDCC